MRISHSPGKRWYRVRDWTSGPVVHWVDRQRLVVGPIVIFLRRKTFDGSKIHMPIKDQLGNVIGELKINEDGTFIGTIYSGSFQDALGHVVKLGFTDGILMSPIVQPPTVPWKRG